MPKRNTTGIREVQDAKGRRRWKFRARYADGRYYESRMYDKISEAIEARQAFLDEKASQKATGRSFREVAVQCLGYRHINGGPSTHAANARTTRENMRLLERYAGEIMDKPIEAIDGQQIHGIINKARGKLSAPRTAKLRDLLRAVFSFAISLGLIEADPVPRLPIRRTQAEQQAAEQHLHVITEKQLRALCEATEARESRNGTAPDNLTHSRIFSFLFRTGLRRQEALSVRFCDIDPGRQLLSLQDQQRGGKRVPLKNRSSRRCIDLGPACMAILEAQRTRYGAEWDSPRLVFGDTAQVPGETLRRALRAAVKAANKTGAGIPEEFTLHDFRHSHASVLLAAGLPPTAVAARLGHSTVRETLQTYAHFVPECGQSLRQFLAESEAEKSSPQLTPKSTGQQDGEREEDCQKVAEKAGEQAKSGQ